MLRVALVILSGLLLLPFPSASAADYQSELTLRDTARADFYFQAAGLIPGEEVVSCLERRSSTFDQDGGIKVGGGTVSDGLSAFSRSQDDECYYFTAMLEAGRTDHEFSVRGVWVSRDGDGRTIGWPLIHSLGVTGSSRLRVTWPRPVDPDALAYECLVTERSIAKKCFYDRLELDEQGRAIALIVVEERLGPERQAAVRLSFPEGYFPAPRLRSSAYLLALPPLIFAAWVLVKKRRKQRLTPPA